MAMSPSDQAIVGGTLLRIPAIQSPDFVAGVSGWIIRADGSAEFNTGTFRGSIEVGSLTGAHFIVNNSATGDVIDVYNSSNQLVFSIDSAGNTNSFDHVNNLQGIITGAEYTLKDLATGSNAAGQMNLFPAGTIGSTRESAVFVEATNGARNAGQLAVISQSDDGTSTQPTVKALERSVFGSVLVSDNGQSVNNLVHVDHYSGTVGANGVWTFAHNCGFTPVEVVMTPWDAAGAQSRNYPVLGSTTISGGNCATQWWDGVGNRVANGVTVGVRAAFFG